MKIGLDVDSTICESMPVILTEVERVTGCHLTKEDIKEYDQVVNGTSIGIIIRDLYKNSPWVLLSMEPIEGATEGVARLYLENDIIFITSRHDNTRKVTESWIIKHFGSPATIIHTGPSEDKTAHDFDLLIDDSPHFAEKFASTGHDVLLYDQPWNQKVRETHYITRVKSWADIVRLIG